MSSAKINSFLAA